MLAGPWAGALTGLLANLIWSILPVPGGAGPTIAFFAPVAGVIGLMAGFWASRGVFRLRADDARVGGFLALAAGVGAAAHRAARRPADGRPARSTSTIPDSQTRFVTLGAASSSRSASSSRGSRAGRSSRFEPATRGSGAYLTAATAIAAFALVFALAPAAVRAERLLLDIDGVDDDGAPDTSSAART